MEEKNRGEPSFTE